MSAAPDLPPGAQQAPTELDRQRARDAGQKAARLNETPANWAAYPVGSLLSDTFLQAFAQAKAEIADWRTAKGV